jgi:hypothetical protein
VWATVRRVHDDAMTTTDELSTADPGWRRLAVTPVLTLVAVAVLWNAAAFAIDASPLEQAVDSWGYAFASVLLTIVLGGVAGVLTVGAALAGSLGPSGWARPVAWCGAVVDGVCGVAMLLASASLLAEPAAGVVFGLLTAPLGLVLTVPLVLCVRRARAT